MSVESRFSAVHQLRLADGSRESPHRHDWRVRVTWGGAALDATGVLADFAALRGELETVLVDLRGGRLNELPALAGRNPSAENLAVLIAEGLGERPVTAARLRWVEVEEEPGCAARYYPE